MKSYNRLCAGMAGALILGVVLITGCGEKPDLPDAEVLNNNTPSTTIVKPTRPPQSPMPSVAEPVSTAQDDGASGETVSQDIPIRVAALINRLNGDVRVGLVGENEDDYVLLGVGDSYKGYQVMSVNMNEEEVLLQRDGKEYRLKLQRSEMLASQQETTVQMPVELASEQGVDGSLQPSTPPSAGNIKAPVMQAPTVYKATANEKEQGIDPNDPSTWKPGYMGPGIERARNANAPASYTPTDKESSSGIDPNNPASWPEGYRGPGIERMAEQMDKQPKMLIDE
jgi:hypothetical protein